MTNNINSRPYLIAITGSLGTGKSKVGELLSEIGVYVIDTDDVVKDILKSKNQATLKIIKEFGSSVINEKQDEYINKKELSNIVFSDIEKRKKLESIIHPEVRSVVSNLISFNKDKNLIVVLIPLLFEVGLETHYDETWCVICNEDVQIDRLVKKGYSLEEAQGRIKAQLSQSEKAKLAGYIIDNSGRVEKTKEQVINRLKLLAQSNQNLHAFFCKEH